jgi:hypothetical protein
MKASLTWGVADKFCETYVYIPKQDAALCEMHVILLSSAQDKRLTWVSNAICYYST